jgi:hypothetical protein
VDAKHAWNKIIQEQTQSNPYMDLQVVTKKGPRGPSCKSFDDYVMFHLLTMFPIKAAEQERYYLMNVLKKPQRVSVCQFVQHVKQLNSYIVQLPGWLYSPIVKPTTIPANDPFTKADLVSHVLQMCPLTWQDQFNLHKKGMTSLDTCLLLMSLEAIEHICTQESPTHNPMRKLLTRVRKETRQILLSEFSKKLAPRSIATSARSMGARILRTPQETVVSMRKMGQRKPISVPPRKAERNPIPPSSLLSS